MVARDDTLTRIAGHGRRFTFKRHVEAAMWSLSRPAFALLRAAAVKRPANASRILVVQRILRIGDTLVARPALHVLRDRRPGVAIGVVCSPSLTPLCRADHLVDVTIEAKPGWWREARRWHPDETYVFVTDRWSAVAASVTGAPLTVGYDYAGRGAPLRVRRPTPSGMNIPFSLYPPGTPRIRAADIWVQLVAPGAPATQEYPPLDVGNEAREEARTWMSAAGIGTSTFVVCHTQAANPAYNWDDGRWTAVARYLQTIAFTPVWTGGTADAGRVRRLATLAATGVVAAGELSLLATFALVEQAAMVISVDTALVHIAATVRTPVVGLYGPGDEEMWAPLGVPHRVLTAPSLCRGCKCATCFQPQHFCMEGIHAEEVIAACEDLRREVGIP